MPRLSRPRFYDRFVIATQISCRSIAKFLCQVRVSDKIKEPTFDAADVFLPIQRPDLFDRVLFESRQVFRVVYIPTRGDVVNAADEIVPRRLSRQLLNPGFVALYEITLQPEANGEPGRSRSLDHIEVPRQIVDRHPPGVELLRHRVVVGEADLG